MAANTAIDRTDKGYDGHPVLAKKRAEAEAKKNEAAVTINQLEAEARKAGGQELLALERRIAEAKRPTDGELRPEYGYHSAIESKQDRMKWVQVDLGSSAKIDRIVLRPCW